MGEFVSDYGLWISYILIGVATAAAIVMPLINSLSDPASLKGAGIGVGSLVVLFFISYALSGDEVTAKYTQFGVDAGTSQVIGGFLTMMYLLLLIVTVAIVYAEVSKIFK